MTLILDRDSWSYVRVISPGERVLNPEKTWIVVGGTEIEARKAVPGYFEVYEVEVRTGDLGGFPGIRGWLGLARK